MRPGRIVWLVVLTLGLGAWLFLGTAIWWGWMNENLAVFLSSTNCVLLVVLRWTLFRRYVGRPERVGEVDPKGWKPD